MQEDRRLKRWFQKTFPPRAFNYLSSIAQLQRGEVVVADRDSIKIPDEMSMAEMLFSGHDILATLVTNYNVPKMQSLIGSGDAVLNKMFAGKSVSGELGEWFSNTVFTSPLKIYDVYRHAFINDKVLSSSEFRENKPKTFWDGFLKGQINDGMWKAYNSSAE
jgi:hypothetical protein